MDTAIRLLPRLVILFIVCGVTVGFEFKASFDRYPDGSPIDTRQNLYRPADDNSLRLMTYEKQEIADPFSAGSKSEIESNWPAPDPYEDKPMLEDLSKQGTRYHGYDVLESSGDGEIPAPIIDETIPGVVPPTQREDLSDQMITEDFSNTDTVPHTKPDFHVQEVGDNFGDVIGQLEESSEQRAPHDSPEELANLNEKVPVYTSKADVDSSSHTSIFHTYSSKDDFSIVSTPTHPLDSSTENQNRAVIADNITSNEPSHELILQPISHQTISASLDMEPKDGRYELLGNNKPGEKNIPVGDDSNSFTNENNQNVSGAQDGSIDIAVSDAGEKFSMKSPVSQQSNNIHDGDEPTEMTEPEDNDMFNNIRAEENIINTFITQGNETAEENSSTPLSPVSQQYTNLHYGGEPTEMTESEDNDIFNNIRPEENIMNNVVTQSDETAEENSSTPLFPNIGDINDVDGSELANTSDNSNEDKNVRVQFPTEAQNDLEGHRSTSYQNNFEGDNTTKVLQDLGESFIDDEPYKKPEYESDMDYEKESAEDSVTSYGNDKTEALVVHPPATTESVEEGPTLVHDKIDQTTSRPEVFEDEKQTEAAFDLNTEPVYNRGEITPSTEDSEELVVEQDKNQGINADSWKSQFDNDDATMFEDDDDTRYDDVRDQTEVKNTGSVEWKSAITEETPRKSILPMIMLLFVVILLLILGSRMPSYIYSTLTLIRGRNSLPFSRKWDKRGYSILPMGDKSV